MIEFGTKRSGGGKKSRLHKKFPRKKIDKVGEKVAGWFRSNWDDDSYPYFSGNLRKFLLSNVGRPVDKVFSEFYRKIAASLSPLIVQQMMLDKWDGKLPVYGTVPTLFKDIAGK